MKLGRGYEPLILVLAVYLARAFLPLTEGTLQGVDSWFLAGDAKFFVDSCQGHLGCDVLTGYNNRWPGSLVHASYAYMILGVRGLAFIGALYEALAFLVLYALARRYSAPNRAMLAVLSVSLAYSSVLFGVQLTKENLARPVIFGVLTGAVEAPIILPVMVGGLIVVHHLTPLAWGVGFLAASTVAAIAGRSDLFKRLLVLGALLLIGEYVVVEYTGGFTFVKGGVALSRAFSIAVTVVASSSGIALALTRSGRARPSPGALTVIFMVFLASIIIAVRPFSPDTVPAGIVTVSGAVVVAFAILLLLHVRCDDIVCMVVVALAAAFFLEALVASAMTPIVGPSTVVRLVNVALYMVAIAVARSSQRNVLAAFFGVSLIMLFASGWVLLTSGDPVNMNLVYSRVEVDPLMPSKLFGGPGVWADVPGGAAAFYHGVWAGDICSRSPLAASIVYVSPDNLVLGCRDYGFLIKRSPDYYSSLIGAGDVVYTNGASYLVRLGGGS